MPPTSRLRVRQKSFYVGSRKDRTWRTYLVEVWAERDGAVVAPAIVRIILGQDEQPARVLLPATGATLTVADVEPVLRVIAHSMSLARAYERRRIKAVSGLSPVSGPAESVD